MILAGVGVLSRSTEPGPNHLILPRLEQIPSSQRSPSPQLFPTPAGFAHKEMGTRRTVSFGKNCDLGTLICFVPEFTAILALSSLLTSALSTEQ